MHLNAIPQPPCPRFANSTYEVGTSSSNPRNLGDASFIASSVNHIIGSPNATPYPTSIALIPQNSLLHFLLRINYMVMWMVGIHHKPTPRVTSDPVSATLLSVDCNCQNYRIVLSPLLGRFKFETKSPSHSSLLDLLPHPLLWTYRLIDL